MKATKQIFCFNGNENDVRQVLAEVSGFKAISVVKKSASIEEIKEVFSNNKSVACTSFNESGFILQFCPINIFVTKTPFNISGNIIDIRHNIVRQFMEIASKYNIDVGDHISNSTNKDKGQSKTNCVFCKLLAGKPIHEQKSLYESQNFLVVPGSGSFIDGYLMILPKEHVMSCAELSKEMLKEMNDVISDVKFILKSVYGNEVLIWENGSGMGGKGKPQTSIVHAHIHACPCPNQLNICNVTKMTGVTVHHIEKRNLKNYYKDSYLLIIDFDNQWYIASDAKLYIPRQYIRQLLAMELNISGDVWDWRHFPFWNNVEKTAQNILSFLKNNFQSLSPRIQKATKKFVM